MSKIEIFDPAMCCSTGLCGPGVDQELLRVTTTINTLTKKGVTVIRYGLSSEPQVGHKASSLGLYPKELNFSWSVSHIGQYLDIIFSFVFIFLLLQKSQHSQVTNLYVYYQAMELIFVKDTKMELTILL